MKPENHLKSIRLISFAHVWLFFTGIKTVCSSLKLNFYNLCMLYASPKWGGGTTIIIFKKLFIHSFNFILIILSLYRRKFCDGHIILIFFKGFDREEKTKIHSLHCLFIKRILPFSSLEEIDEILFHITSTHAIACLKYRHFCFQLSTKNISENENERNN